MKALKKITNQAGWSLSLFLLVFSMQVKGSALSGSYTINPSGSGSSNFPSFTAAVDTLTNDGVSGAVVFDVASGVYNEQISIGSISGASSSNTIAFQSSGASYDSVVLTNSGSYTLIFNGAHYITFHGITIQNTGTSGSVNIENSSSHDSLSSCKIRATYQYAETIYMYGYSSPNDYITIYNCAIHGGEMGIYAFGSYSSPYQIGTVITGNSIDSFFYYGIMSYYADSIVISKNLISNPKTNGYDYFGIYIVEPQSGGYFISKNKIVLPSAQYSSYGIYFDYGAFLSSSDTSMIDNNFISLIGGTSQSYGFYAYYDQYTNFVFNSIEITNTNTNSAGIYDYDYSGSGMTFENNISSNTGGGYSIYVYNSSSAGTLNYNDWYIPSTSSYLGYWSGSTEATLSDWQSASSQDANSVSADPVFASVYDLTPNASALYHVGTPITGITDDINDTLRNTSTPDIGAVEFKTIPVLAGVSAVDSPGSGFCAGTLPIYVTVKNFGTTTLTSATIDWTINGGTASTYSWTGSLSQGQTSLVNIGSQSFSANTLYNIKAYLTIPNGTTNGNNNNDTSTAAVQNGIGGTYSIGGTSPDYATFSAAVSDLTTRGLCSKVIFNVRNGTYNESVYIGNIAGTSAVKTVTFQSATGTNTAVILQNSGDSNTITLNGVNYVSFKNMTIQNLGTNGYNTFSISGGSSYDSLSGSILRNAYQYAQIVYVGNGNNPDNFNTIKNCSIHGGYYGILSIYDDSNVISKNMITNPNSANASNAYGIYLEETYAGGVYIYDNKILFPNGGNSGIYMYYLQNGTTTTPVMIYNNFISIGGTNQCYGIYEGYYYVQNVMAYYNNIYITNTNSYSTGIYNGVGYTMNGSPYGINIVNNISENVGGGYAVEVDNGYVDTMNYNDYYVPSTSSYLGDWTGSTVSSLSSWQSTSSQDANSVSVEAGFVSNTNLTPSAVSLYHGGTPVYGISTDINGKKRNTSTPDIGAVEFKPYNYDAGITAIDSPSTSFCTAGKLAEYVTIKDFGIQTLTSANIYFSVNGGTPSKYAWTGSLTSGSTALVYLGTGSFTSSSPYNLKAYTSDPNGVLDSNPSNDTSNATVSKGISGVYTIGGTSPDYATFTDAVNALNTSGFCGKVIFNVRDGIYNEALSFNGFASSSPSASITFQGASGDSSKVILENSSTVLTFTTTSFVNFKEMTIENTGSSSVANYTSSSFDSISHCIIRGTYQYAQNIYLNGNSGVNYHIDIDNNAMHGGGYAVYSYGNFSTSSNQMGTFVTGNIIDSFSEYGIFSVGEDSIVIDKNLIDPVGTGYSGIYLDEPYNQFYIYKNKIVMSGSNGVQGIYVYYGYQLSSSDSSLIYDNFISILGGSSQSYGIYMEYYMQNLSVVYNSVNVTNTNTNSSGIYDYFDYAPSGNPAAYYDNISVNTGGGYAVYEGYSYYHGTYNYNDWYVTGSNMGYWGTAEANLSDWQSASSQDANSVSGNPDFATSTNLTPSSSLVYHTGTPLIFPYGIQASHDTTDIFGTTRNYLTPDMGAVEFTPAHNDAGVASIDSPGAGFCPGTFPVYVTFKNYGLDTIYSVTIDWSVNGTAQTAYKFTSSTGIYPSGSQQVQLGSLSFAANTVYNITAYTYQPNGLKDGNDLNDTASSSVSNGLSGTYTIGGSSPDYATFSAADSALLKHGLCGSVIFNVRNGTYNEYLTFTSFPGASSSKTVTFQSASGDSSKVILTSSNYSSVNNGATVFFNGASDIIFREITIQNTYNSYPDYAVYFENSSSFDSIQHCVIRGTYQYGYPLYISGYSNPNTYLDVDNTAIHGGEMGIYDEGSYSSPYQYGIVLNSNVIDSFNYYGIYTVFEDSVTIIGNSIQNPMSSGYDNYGIYLVEPHNFYILKNRINLPGNAQYGNYGIYFDYGFYLLSNDTSVIANNFISIGNGSATAYGIYLYYYAEYMNIVFNNINILNTNTSSSAFYDYYAFSSALIEDNIGVNSGGGYAVYASYTSYPGTLDYNDWYVPSTSSYLGNWGGSGEAALSDWQSASSQDASSVSGDPAFATATNLTPSSAVVYHDGTPIYGVPRDINDTLRSTTTPDIGAVEFVPLHNDAGVSSIDSPGAGFCAGKLPVYATFRNFGLDTIFSITIDWSVNGTAQTAYSYTSSTGVLPGQTAQVYLGTLTFAANTLYNIKAYTYLPNGNKDLNDKNDTFTAGVENGLSGTYTIGGTSPDYASFSAAIADVKAKGLCSSVIFNVANGTYNESLTISGIVGLSATKTITFQGASGDSSTVNLTNYSTPLTLNGASYVNFKEMTISNTGYSNVIYIEGGSSYDSISHCIVRANYQYGQDIYIYGYGNPNNYLTINECAIHGGEASILSEGNYSSPYQIGPFILKNTMDSFSYYGYGVESIYGDSTVIDSNQITNTSSSCYYFYGIFMELPRNGFYISQNTISAPSAAYYGTYGIYFYYGLYLSSSNPGMIYNNFISIGSGGYDPAYGFYAYYYPENINFVFNTINISNTNSGSVGIYTSPYAYGTSNFVVENNLSINTGGGYAIGVGSSSYAPSTCNYNDLYVSGSGSSLGDWGGTAEANLSDWQSASSQDANSISVNPNFVSSTDPHVHASGLFKSGTPISGIAKDIYDSIRSTSAPTDGAVEFYPAANVTAVSSLLTPTYGECGGVNTAITIVVENNGSANQKNLLIHTIISGATSITLDTTLASLPSGTIDTITYGKYLNTSSGGTFKFTSYVKDTFLYNDTLTQSVFINEQSPSPSVKNGAICYPGKDTLYATPGVASDSIYWYSSKSGRAITSGTTFITPHINTTTTFYALESSRRDTFFWGPSSINAVSTTDQTGSSSAGIVFNVTTPITIDSITVYPSSSGNVGVTLYDSSGRPLKTIYSSVSVLYSYTPVNIPVGITVGTGNNFSLALDSSNTGGFYYNNGGASYPYTIKNVCSITNTTTNEGSAGYYYGPYNLQIHTGSCPSAFVAVTATIGAPTASFTKDASSGGKFNKGTVASPDAICPGSTFIYDLGTSFTNSGYNTAWGIPAYSLVSTTGTSASSNLTFTPPTSTSAGTFSFAAQSSQVSDTFILKVNVKDLVKGCDTVIIRRITVSGVPNVTISPATACMGVSESYRDSTVSAGSTLKWSFGDGSGNATGANPLHTYSKAGTYTITLSVTNAAGCTDSTSAKVTVNNPPTAAFGVTNAGCPGQSAQFTDSSTASGSDSIIDWKYDFGDGSSVSTSRNPSHQYSASGSYTVTQTVTSTGGCTNTTTRTVTVLSGPTASFTSNTACSGDSTYFTNTGTTGANYAWSFGDPAGGTSTLASPAYRYALAGTYTVKLTVTTSGTGGCSSSASNSVTVNVRPIAGINAPASACAGTPVNIDDSSQTSVSISYLWNFGDGSATSTVANNSHKYANAGTYTISYRIQSIAGGCPDSMTQNITINPTPTAKFGVDTSACTGSALQFTDSSTGATSYSWNFGDGVGTSATKSPSYAYTSFGSYTVTENVTNASGCSSKETKNVTVYPSPVDTFAYTASKNVVTFAQSDVSDSSTWTYGDGTNSTAGKNTINPSHTYPSTIGTKSYYATLTTWSTSSGCTYTYSDSVRVTVKTGINNVLAQSMNLQIAPNPFKDEVRIEYTLPNAQDMRLSIFDVTGKEVTVIANGHQEAGKYMFNVDAAKYNMQAGVYFLHIVAGNEAIDEKIIRIN